jgi:hypothetical protein
MPSSIAQKIINYIYINYGRTHEVRMDPSTISHKVYIKSRYTGPTEKNYEVSAEITDHCISYSMSTVISFTNLVDPPFRERIVKKIDLLPAYSANGYAIAVVRVINKMMADEIDTFLEQTRRADFDT